MLLAGLLMGSAGTHAWDVSQEAAWLAADVSLLAMFSPQVMLQGSKSGGRTSVTDTILLINTGRLPIALISLQAHRPGLAVASHDGARTIGPAEQIQVDVTLDATCPTADLPGVLPMSATVRTSNRLTRTVELPLEAADRRWASMLSNACSSQDSFTFTMLSPGG